MTLDATHMIDTNSTPDNQPECPRRDAIKKLMDDPDISPADKAQILAAINLANILDEVSKYFPKK